MSKTYKGDVTGNVVELNLLDANEGTLPNLGTPTVVTRNTGPNDVTQVVGDITSSNGFSSDGSVKGLVIGTSCTSIGDYSFYFCTNLAGSSITIPDSVTTIGDWAFNSSLGFSGTLTIPDSVTSIGSNAFSYIGSNTLVIGSGVTSIGSDAFYGNFSITAVYTNCPASSFTGTNAFFLTNFTTIYTGPNATGYTSSFQGRTGLTIAPWTNYPNIP